MSSRTQSNHSHSAAQSWPIRSHITIYLRCLHLLDFDLLEDWPGVSEQLFNARTAQQTLQQRVKAVEWSLYRLSEVSDPDETKDKLRPFFPPATQLQSLNLRAALYRYLTELKKNGVLGKDVLLRKTMLDDCKGERFEEFLASFAMIALRKTIGVAKNPPPPSRLLPLNLTYRVVLHRTVQKRQQMDADAKEQLQHLAKIEQNLQKRLAESRRASLMGDIAKQGELVSSLNHNWIGNNAWTEVLLGRIPGTSLLNDVHPSDNVPNVKESQRLLDDLEARIRRQQDRLAQWKVVAKDFTFTSATTSKTGLPKVDPATSVGEITVPAKFDEHKALHIAQWQANPISKAPIDQQYQNLILAMKRELSANYIPTLSPLAAANEENTSRVDRPTTPAKGFSSSPPKTPLSIIEPHLPEREPADATSLPGANLYDRDGPARPSMSPLLTSDCDDTSWVPHPENNVTSFKEDYVKPVRDKVPSQTDDSQPLLSPSKLWMSLADRTRASMSLTGRQSILTDPDSPNNHNIVGSANETVSDLHQSSDDERHVTLLERTRKSMSMLSSASGSRHREPRREKRISQAFPVNQFETPGRLRWREEQADTSRSSTPRDQLFDEDAEYSSVFKSRPKLALSPSFSPERRTSGLNIILEMGMEDLDLNAQDGS